ncbi:MULTISPECIES: precorrin-6y C5,15-methyltransferase (decarboxylating) subunit CbiE [unclassified Paracoccus (in: a-proteobacteria)]|uniref:precorrin-6y C5,15-methyltransferase (decarboxylating) subunit CbiE n=1 Tax=unclassified Paracoccus (in: a-proteobacteria) TaxID=2688777 RepID=UPI0021E146F1|nr:MULTISPECIES: precorrin-6y C5,15-methyltransferase (decarboxylating) subunit CbiE [unclassified Paracoccus (in: a-proteobacteria)]UXU75977.1 precorrin-6y C5,15-methyltransferase (decarboxylating) subunit CbiE [Paracoccus sp. SMMA_5]UXU81886.1 precorrin-6y C5,15-methyltransferase (decarboxylating) subunit CbiE [Paracoccus sp. SMMA_5_TC]
MSEPWLSIIGLGEDGLAGLPPASRQALAGAEIVFGAPRHLALAGCDGRPWPVPFDIAPLLALRGRPVAALVSGDPFWHGAGSLLAQALPAAEWRAFPVPGTFSLAAARLGWALDQTVCLGLHAAPFARLLPIMTRGARAICLLRDGDSPRALAEWLVAQGLGATSMVVLESLGGPRERLRRTRASGFDLTDCAAPVAVALDGRHLPAGSGLPRGFGLPDAHFAHDGQITRRAIRAVTLAALAPRTGEMLWDIGGGSGSVSVEWCLNGGWAVTVEPRADRLDHIRANIDAFGLSGQMQPVEGRAPQVLAGLPPPDAIFVGGGADAALIAALPPARLVVNAVTLETEALLLELHSRRGGRLLRLAVEEAGPLGGLRGWTPARAITQWSWP